MPRRSARSSPTSSSTSARSSPEYAELADRIQKETGVPYILLDGSLARTAETLRTLGKLLGKEADAAALAEYTRKIRSDELK